MNSDFTSIPVHKDTYEKALFLARKSNKPISTVMDELLSSVFQIAMNFETLSLTYELSILSSTCTVKAEGKSTFFIGSCPNEKELEKRLGKREKAK